MTVVKVAVYPSLMGSKLLATLKPLGLHETGIHRLRGNDQLLPVLDGDACASQHVRLAA